jgi:hypothetical protein
VFRRKAASPSRTLPETAATTLATLRGPWDVAFRPNLGAPEKIKLKELESWTQNPDDGVKYFSGTASYAKTIQIQNDWLKPETRILLDLGTVKDIAKVSVNGRPAAVLWKPPYRADISGFLKAGKNRLEIDVTNQWTNRLIGDRELDPEKKVLASSSNRMLSFGPTPTLAKAGLIGPVTLVSLKRVKSGTR